MTYRKLNERRWMGKYEEKCRRALTINSKFLIFHFTSRRRRHFSTLKNSFSTFFFSLISTHEKMDGKMKFLEELWSSLRNFLRKNSRWFITYLHFTAKIFDAWCRWNFLQSFNFRLNMINSIQWSISFLSYFTQFSFKCCKAVKLSEYKQDVLENLLMHESKICLEYVEKNSRKYSRLSWTWVNRD